MKLNTQNKNDTTHQFSSYKLIKSCQQRNFFKFKFPTVYDDIYKSLFLERW